MFTQINHSSVTTFLIILIAYTLIGDDFRLAVTPKAADPAFNVITILAMILFTVEIVLNSLCQYNYWNSFYFWLDIIATVTMIFDITWCWNALVYGGDDYVANSVVEASEAVTADEGEHLGTKVGAFYSVIRLIRLIRVGRLWKYANQRLNILGDEEEDEVEDEYGQKM